jgi:hypothetical protein
MQDLQSSQICSRSRFKTFRKDVLWPDMSEYNLPLPPPRLLANADTTKEEEVVQSRYTILDIHPRAVELLVNFLYVGDYEIPDVSHFSNPKNRRMKYILHARMVIAAEKYEMAASARVAAANFRRACFRVGNFRYKTYDLAHALSNTCYIASKEFYDTMVEAWSFWELSPNSESGCMSSMSSDGSDDDSADDTGTRISLMTKYELFWLHIPNLQLALQVNCGFLRCSSCDRETELTTLPDDNYCDFCEERSLSYFGATIGDTSDTIWDDMYAIGQTYG